MKYKEGDRVRIKSLDWYNENKSKSHGTVACGGKYVDYDMREWCGKIMTILTAYQTCYIMQEDGAKDLWTDEMIEGLVEEKTKPEPKFKVGDILFYRGETCGYLKVEEIREENGEIRYYETSRNIYLVENHPDVFVDKVCSVETEETKNNNDMEEKETLLGWVKESDNLRLVPHKDYEIKHDGDNFYLVKKKKEYPKTYKECAEIIAELTGSDCNPKGCMGYMSVQLTALQKLLICRDAYWKIAGEEMGFEKPWKPDWTNISDKYCIYFVSGDVWSKECQTRQCPFTFPTAEMRDAFKENFKSEIEMCKELL